MSDAGEMTAFVRAVELGSFSTAARELGRLELAGTRVRLRLDDQGLEQLTPERLATLVGDFRAPR